MRRVMGRGKAFNSLLRERPVTNDLITNDLGGAEFEVPRSDSITATVPTSSRICWSRCPRSKPPPSSGIVCQPKQ